MAAKKQNSRSGHRDAPNRICAACDTPVSSNAMVCHACGARIEAPVGPSKTYLEVHGREIVLVAVLVVVLGVFGAVTAYRHVDRPLPVARGSEPGAQNQGPLALNPVAVVDGQSVPATSSIAASNRNVAMSAPSNEDSSEFESEGGRLFTQAARAEERMRGLSNDPDAASAMMGESIELYRAAAEEGHPAAMVRLALLYEEGTWVSQDLRRAGTYYLEAGEAGVDSARTAAGLLFSTGEFPLEVCPPCLDWLVSASSKGVPEAQLALGYVYLNGVDVPVDREQAFAAFERAARSGMAKAYNEVGYLLLEGNGKNPDVPGAYRNFLRGAAAGDPQGLGSFVERLKKEVDQKLDETFPVKSPGDPIVVRKNNGAIVRGRLVSTDRTSVVVEEEGREGKIRFTDIDVGSRSVLDPAFRRRLAGIRLYEALGDLGEALGSREVADALASLRVPILDEPEHIRVNGLLHYQGSAGPVDYSTAYLWFRLAAQAGDPIAQHYLGVMYYHGRGVEANRTRSLIWLERASNSGHRASEEFIRSHFQRQSAVIQNRETGRTAMTDERAFDARALLVARPRSAKPSDT